MKFSILKTTGNTLLKELQPVIKDYDANDYYNIKNQLQFFSEIIREVEETLENMDRKEQKRLKEYQHVRNDAVRFI